MKINWSLMRELEPRRRRVKTLFSDTNLEKLLSNHGGKDKVLNNFVKFQNSLTVNAADFSLSTSFHLLFSSTKPAFFSFQRCHVGFR